MNNFRITYVRKMILIYSLVRRMDIKMKSKLFFVGAVLVLLLAIGVTWTLAQIDGEIYSACVNNASGTIHMIQSGETCNNNEILYTWNNEGPEGPPGADDADGAPGTDGAD